MGRKNFWIAGVAALIVIATAAALLIPRPAPEQDAQQPAVSPDLEAAEDAFYTLQSESDLIRIVPHGACCFALGELRPNEVAANGQIALYIMSEQDGEYQILSSYHCDPILSPGFVAEVLHFEEMTIVFGGVGEKFVLFPGGEETVSFDAAEVRTTYSDQQEDSASLSQNETFLFVRDAAVDVSDIQFSVDGEVVTGYVKVYDEPPVLRQLEASGSDG